MTHTIKPAATPRERNTARELAAMASVDGYVYEPTDRTMRFADDRTVWYEMRKTAPLPQHTYWLARDQGTYRGSFMDG